MLSLGFWQLSRADEKIELQTQADAAMAAEPVPLREVSLDPSGFRYRRVTLNGRFEPANQLLWDNRISGGVAGYEVITPFRTDSGKMVLVNRGWLPAGLDRTQLPDVAFVPSDSNETVVVGMLTRPSIGFSSGAAIETADGWPKRLQHFSFDEIAVAMNAPLVPGLLQDVTSSVVPMYNNNWSPAASGPERHYGYAFQWFAMFAALTALFVFLNGRRVSKST